jgi:hypothetical protein
MAEPGRDLAVNQRIGAIQIEAGYFVLAVNNDCWVPVHPVAE